MGCQSNACLRDKMRASNQSGKESFASLQVFNSDLSRLIKLLSTKGAKVFFIRVGFYFEILFCYFPFNILRSLVKLYKLFLEWVYPGDSVSPKIFDYGICSSMKLC